MTGSRDGRRHQLRLIVELLPDGAIPVPHRLRKLDGTIDEVGLPKVHGEVREAEGDVLNEDVEVERPLPVRQRRGGSPLVSASTRNAWMRSPSRRNSVFASEQSPQ